jgi:hypothetical protein
MRITDLEESSKKEDDSDLLQNYFNRFLLTFC